LSLTRDYEYTLGRLSIGKVGYNSFVFTPRLGMKLLAPTVLVSLALVAACIFGLFYLNDLHVEASDVLSENERSTRAAMRLETSTRALIHSL